MATFITSKAVGETIAVGVQTSTGYWKYNHNGSDTQVLDNTEDKTKTNISITNVNGEFTIIPCDLEGNVTGNITHLHLYTNQLTSFDGTGLSGLTELWLSNNQLTSFDGTGLSSLTQLGLYDNQLTSFDGTGLSSLTYLNIGENQLTSFDKTDLSSLTYLNLNNNQLTSLDVWNLLFLQFLYVEGNLLTATANDSILDSLENHRPTDASYFSGEFNTTGGRTSAGTADYDTLLGRGWTLSGLDLASNPTFITSKSVGQDITILAHTSTGYWKYNHDGSDSSVFSNGSQTITVANANGEFTIIPCLSDGTVSGDITGLNLQQSQLTSFNSTGLTSLGFLTLTNNQLTSFDGTDLTSLTSLKLGGNLLTSFDGTGLSSLTTLYLQNNQFTSFDGTGLSSLTYLDLKINQLTSFDGTDLGSLIELYLSGNQLTPSINNQILNLLDQYGLENGGFFTTGGRTSAGTADYDALVAKGWTLSGLDLTFPVTFITAQSVGQDINIGVETSTGYWKYNHDGSDSSVFSNGKQTITVANANGEFTIIPCLSDGTVSGNITQLNLNMNQITSFDGTGLSSLTYLSLNDNQLTSFDGTGLTSLTYLYLYNNQLTSLDVSSLTSLTGLVLYNNQLTSLDVSSLTSLAYLYLNDDKVGSNPMTPESNNSILSQLDDNGLSNGQFSTINGRTSAGTADYDALIAKGWELIGLDLVTPPPSGNGKLRIKGVNSGGGTNTIPQWDGGTIYNIGAVVTHEGQTWNCIRYAPAGYGPFGGYIDVYWTL